jgi:hypothetical protein
MHRDIGAMLLERTLQLLNEQSLAANVGKRGRQHAVALRGHAEDPHVQAWIERDQAVANVIGLPQGQCTLASSYGYAIRERQRSPLEWARPSGLRAAWECSTLVLTAH